jgi:hypothetical protein
MKSYVPVGWRGESHRHYLAAKGVKTNFFASKTSIWARERALERLGDERFKRFIGDDRGGANYRDEEGSSHLFPGLFQRVVQEEKADVRRDLREVADVDVNMTRRTKLPDVVADRHGRLIGKALPLPLAGGYSEQVSKRPASSEQALRALTVQASKGKSVLDARIEADKVKQEFDEMAASGTDEAEVREVGEDMRESLIEEGYSDAAARRILRRGLVRSKAFEQVLDSTDDPDAWL